MSVLITVALKTKHETRFWGQVIYLEEDKRNPEQEGGGGVNQGRRRTNKGQIIELVTCNAGPSE